MYIEFLKNPGDSRDIRCPIGGENKLKPLYGRMSCIDIHMKE